MGVFCPALVVSSPTCSAVVVFCSALEVFSFALVVLSSVCSTVVAFSSALVVFGSAVETFCPALAPCFADSVFPSLVPSLVLPCLLTRVCIFARVVDYPSVSPCLDTICPYLDYCLCFSDYPPLPSPSELSSPLIDLRSPLDYPFILPVLYLFAVCYTHACLSDHALSK